jgi:Tfp pilus assembly protein PilX
MCDDGITNGGPKYPPLPPFGQTGISSNYTALASDYYIGVNGTNVTVTLPLGSSVVAGKTYVIKDESGLISGNTAYRVTIAASGPNLIDGSASITVTQSFTALTVFWTGSFWSII